MTESQVARPAFPAPLLHLCPRNLLSLLTISLLPLPLFRYFFFYGSLLHSVSLIPSSLFLLLLLFSFSFPQPDLGFPGGSVVKNSPPNSGEASWIPGSGRSPGEGNGNPFHSSCLGNPMDRGARWAVAHGVTKGSDTTE